MFPFLVVFVVFLGSYLITSEWAGLDARYLVILTVSVFLGVVIASILGDAAVADNFAMYAVLLIAGCAVLTTFRRLRRGVARPVPFFE